MSHGNSELKHSSGSNITNEVLAGTWCRPQHSSAVALRYHKLTDLHDAMVHAPHRMMIPTHPPTHPPIDDDEEMSPMELSCRWVGCIDGSVDRCSADVAETSKSRYLPRGSCHLVSPPAFSCKFVE